MTLSPPLDSTVSDLVVPEDPSTAAAEMYFFDLHAGAEGGNLALWAKRPGEERSITRWYSAPDGLSEAALGVDDLSNRGYNVYASVCLHASRQEVGSRGSAATVSVVPGLFMDVDIAGPAHKQANLPPSQEEARCLLDEALPFPPSLIVHSGHGLHAYWLFREPFRVDDEQDRIFASELNRRLQIAIKQAAGSHGWTLDMTADLARVLRPPGSLNVKANAATAVVTVIERSDRRYLLDEFDEFLSHGPDRTSRHESSSSGDTTLADAGLIFAGCPFMRHAKDDAAHLPEPEWQAAMSILGRCHDGERIAHQISVPYPGYAERETQSKFERARDEDKPLRCDTIRYERNGESFCAGCFNWGKVTSPITLGKPRASLTVGRIGAVRHDWELPTPLADYPRPPFPTNTLPAVLADFVEELARETQTPDALPGMAVLSAIAIPSAKRIEVEVRPGWREPMNLYTATGMDSGNRKSAVMRAIAAPIREYEHSLVQAAQLEISNLESERRILEEQLKKTEKRAADAVGDEHLTLRAEAQSLSTQIANLPSKKPPRLLADDVTPQKLAAMMADNEGRMGVLSPEGGFFDILSGRYSKDGKTSELQLFLMAHAGDDLPIDRLGRDGDYLSAPALTLGMAVQTSVIRGLASRPGFRGTGALARIAYAMPESFVGRRMVEPDPMSPEVREDYRRIIKGIFALKPAMDANGFPHPHRLRLAENAYTTFIAFAEELEPRLGPWGDLSHIADWASKLAGLVARIAGDFHTVIAIDQERTPWDHEVSNDVVANAVRLAKDFLIPHAVAAFGEMGVDPCVEDARACRSAILRQGWKSFSRRDLHQAMKHRIPNPDDLDAPLALLTRHGYVRPEPIAAEGDSGADSKRRPGRPASPRYAVNPLWRSQNPQNPQNSSPSQHFESSEGFEERIRRIA